MKKKNKLKINVSLIVWRHDHIMLPIWLRQLDLGVTDFRMYFDLTASTDPFRS